MSVRRVVTGQNAEGKSVVVSDEQVEPMTIALMPGTEFVSIWGSDAAVRVPTDGNPPPADAWFPPPGGFRFAFVTFAPATVTRAADLDMGAALAEMRRKLPGLAESMEPGQPGMHITDTIDVDLVISGEIWLELDDGVQVQLHKGDCVVENGTRHAWRNKSSEPCVLAAAVIGARRVTA